MELLALLLALAAGNVTAEEIMEAVNDWLDDHPEASTTVEDGSITLAKLNSGVYGTLADYKTYIGIS